MLCFVSWRSVEARRRLISGSSVESPSYSLRSAHTSRYTDLGPKFEDYERVGVLEYVVRAIEPDEAILVRVAKGAVR